MPSLSPTDDNPLATYDPEGNQDQEGNTIPTQQATLGQGQTATSPEQAQALQKEIHGLDKPTDGNTDTSKENGNDTAENQEQQKKEKPIKQRGLATRLLNTAIRNKGQIQKLRQENANLRNNDLKKKQDELDKVREQMKPIESKIHQLKLQRTALIIWASVLTIIALLLAITIILIPIVTFPLLGIAGNMISLIVQRTVKIKLEEEKIKGPKEKEEKLVKDKEDITNQIRKNVRQIQMLTNQRLLSSGKKTVPAT
ncbi:MAG: hypothetical protein AUJ37_00175 [Candidatus Magasanikbacteria bacterium CG1_02_41_34]|nr:MAG: hypothetical protein AUJ37_00175 [Candidatus Magasanikbacteria bacterium CG1_02_41_34]